MTLDGHSAAGPNAGFSFQFERALFWLARSPAGSAVGIETDDDVAIQYEDGAKVLEQDKHSTRPTGTPFGDRSNALWNTLAIWVAALDAKEVATESTRFLMVTNKVLPECLAHQIGRATTADEISACITALEKAAESPPKDISALVTRVLANSSRENLRVLISRCELVDGSKQSAGDGLREQTLGELQLPQWCAATSESIADELLGWIHHSALRLWQQKQPAWIRRDHFVNQLHAVMDRRKRQITRERAENLIPVQAGDLGEKKGSPFVKQLHLITDDDSIVDSAIRDFIRCNIEKNRLSIEGNITDEDWNSFQAALFSRWEKIRMRLLRMKKGQKEEDIGFEIYTDTTEEHREKLAGTDTEQVYLTSGTYHRLADMLRVGWHPRFESLLRNSEGT